MEQISIHKCSSEGEKDVRETDAKTSLKFLWYKTGTTFLRWQLKKM